MAVPAALPEVWHAVAGATDVPVVVTVEGPPVLRAALPVGDLAVASVAASLVAAAELRAAGGRSAGSVALDSRAVAVAFTSERHVRVDGRGSGHPFAPLSAFFATADGWIRLHANYGWHRDRLLGVLGCAGTHDAVATAVARWPALVLEDAVAGAGGCAASVRSPGEWAAHEQGSLVAARPLLELGTVGDAPARPAGRRLRVLDLTRVIAGPVCTRTLAVHGADVLRIDHPAMPEPPLLALDALVGKRSALVDAAGPTGRARLEELLDGADVVVAGYRPGALDRFGLDPASLAARHPGLVVLTLCAWGDDGPWSGRRGFDSLVQAASGIARVEAEGAAPGALPAQALDHASGYLGAAAVLHAVLCQAREGGTWHARVSLAQTAAWLLRGAGARGVGASSSGATEPEPDPTAFVEDVGATPAGRVTLASPPGSLAGEPLHWPSPPPMLGADAPRWL